MKKPEPVIDAELKIVFENEIYVIVSKSGNIPVHEGGLYVNNCITSILERKFGQRMFPVYRLDRETSGLLVFAKSGRDVKKINVTDKRYLAILEGNIESDIIVDAPIGECRGDYMKWKKCVSSSGKPALTKIHPIQFISKDLDQSDATLCEIELGTGRQHQIRVHAQFIGHPVLNDKVYGKSDRLFLDYIEGKTKNTSRQALHLQKISVNGHEFSEELPPDMADFLK